MLKEVTQQEKQGKLIEGKQKYYSLRPYEIEVDFGEGSTFVGTRKDPHGYYDATVGRVYTDNYGNDDLCDWIKQTDFCQLLKQRNEAMRAARWYFDRGGTFAAEQALRHGWAWLGTVEAGYSPRPAADEEEDLTQANAG